MRSTPDGERDNGATGGEWDLPALRATEKQWLENYLERLERAATGLLKRVVVYGSKARGDARPGSDLDVLVLVGDGRDAERRARQLIAADEDEAEDVDHSVVVLSETEWLQDLEMELPFARNVEAEGVQIHPAYRPARSRAGERPPVTRKGIGHAVPGFLKQANGDLKLLAYEVAALRAKQFNIAGMAVQPAFDAVFFSVMAWCLTRGVSVVRRRDLPANVEQHLIEPGALDPRWRIPIRTLWSAWKAEAGWPAFGSGAPTTDDATQWFETAREIYALARKAIAAEGIEIDQAEDAGTPRYRPAGEGATNRSAGREPPEQRRTEG